MRALRLTGSLQFCVVCEGHWQTDATPRMGKGTSGTVVPFHIVAEGSCWLRVEGKTVELVEGDIVAFPFATGHALGVGDFGALIEPSSDLPPKPWKDIPVLVYGKGSHRMRLLCGYIIFDALNFQPLANALPKLLHARTAGEDANSWLRATVRQMIVEADRRQSGSISMLERLTEILLIELIRHHMLASTPETGWLAVMSDEHLGACLTAIHDNPSGTWTISSLAKLAGMSRTALVEQFRTKLSVSPMRYVREWRLHLAAQELRGSRKPITRIAEDAGYGTEAAFNRAFAKTYGAPPAKWRSRQI
jgi:AraC-like DNA-binding protein